MQIFWSWQSDSPPETNKNFIKCCLEKAVHAVAEELRLSDAERPELDHDTKGEPGLVAIADTIFRKIDEAVLFVADVTLVATTDGGKKSPNPNVLIELGYAIKSLSPDRIILIANAASGFTPEELPFDLRHRRGPVTYTLGSGASKEDRSKEAKSLERDLIAALKANLKGVIEDRDAEVSFELYPADPTDASTWLPPDGVLEHRSWFGDQRSEARRVVEGKPHAYLRISAARWARPRPSRKQVHEARDEERLWSFGPWRNGNGGPNALGVVSVGYFDDPSTATAVTQWFDKTGEIWGFSSALRFESDGRQYLATSAFVKECHKHLKVWIAFLERHGAVFPFRVEAGLTGLKGVYWDVGSLGATPLESMDDAVRLVREDRDWSPAAQLGFLTDLVNAICDSFCASRVTTEDVQRLLASV